MARKRRSFSSEYKERVARMVVDDVWRSRSYAEIRI